MDRRICRQVLDCGDGYVFRESCISSVVPLAPSPKPSPARGRGALNRWAIPSPPLGERARVRGNGNLHRVATSLNRYGDAVAGLGQGSGVGGALRSLERCHSQSGDSEDSVAAVQGARAPIRFGLSLAVIYACCQCRAEFARIFFDLCARQCPELLARRRLRPTRRESILQA